MVIPVRGRGRRGIFLSGSRGDGDVVVIVLGTWVLGSGRQFSICDLRCIGWRYMICLICLRLLGLL